MGAAQSTRVESQAKDESCPSCCARDEASGPEETTFEEQQAIIESENDIGSDDDKNDDDDEPEDLLFEERLLVLKESRHLRHLADFFLHPELPVEVDPLCSCRNQYFDRPSSAPPTIVVLHTEYDKEDERQLILNDTVMLKQLAVDYLHPELPVVTTDPCACGRNYFSRPSSARVPYKEADSNAHSLIENDVEELKKLAMNYLHPEFLVVTTDPFACGRNYFNRFSAPQQDSNDDSDNEERYHILEEMHWMKILVDGYMHPEVPVDYLWDESPFAMDEHAISSQSHIEYPEAESSFGRDNFLPSFQCDKDGNLSQSTSCIMMFGRAS